MCQVSRITLVASKNVQIPTVSEFDEIQRGSSISLEDSNSKVHFIIRELEKVWILTEITILPFFRKLGFSRCFTNLGDKDFDNSLSLYFKFLRNDFMK